MRLTERRRREVETKKSLEIFRFPRIQLWSYSGSNRGPSACKADALPAAP